MSPTLTGLGALAKAVYLATEKSTQPLVVIFAARSEARNFLDNFKSVGGAELENRTHYLPPYEFDFHKGFFPNSEIFFERNATLFHALNDPKGRVFVTTVGALSQKVVPTEAFIKATRSLKTQDELLREEFLHNLVSLGYQSQPNAHDVGTFCVRGGVLDVYCPLYEQPLRMEFYGDFIEEIRFFDPRTQRSLQKIDQVSIIPVGLSLLPRKEAFVAAFERVKDYLDHSDFPKAKREHLLEQVRDGILPLEAIYLFPLLSGGSCLPLEYFPKETVFYLDGKQKCLEAYREIELPKFTKNHALFRKENHPICSSEDLFISPETAQDWFTHENHVYFEDFSSSDSDTPFANVPITFNTERSEAKRSQGLLLFEGFAKKFKSWMDEGIAVHVFCHTVTNAERLKALLQPYSIPAELAPENTSLVSALSQNEFTKVLLWQGYVTESRHFPNIRVVILSEEEIFGQKKRVTKSGSSAATDTARLLAGFKDIKMNDLVVHKDFGIGRYLGLKSMDFLGVPNDYVLLEYKDGDKLYIPIYRLNILQKYVGGESAPAMLDKLGSDRWAKAKKKAEHAAQELAAQFLDIQAKRKLLHAHAFSSPGNDYQQFEMEFPFDETPDQLKSIEDTQRDLGQPHPMDRLICGDVGYGKTEVAMRAAFRVALEGKQVAVLVPTTILAFQHFENFKQRLSPTAIRVDLICRLRTSAQIKSTLENLKNGKIDIIIGTHRLFSSDVAFRDLALIVVDEEHRFGVAHKEKLKKMAESVHVLTMTATPIPRTLNMAMTGIKDISIITTPPPNRLSIRTFVCRRAEEVIQEAIQNEVNRGGQVFFVHNRIETIFGIADELKRLLPNVRFEVVHGQVDSDVLEKKMLGFYKAEFDVLVTTAIIESGLDIPRANTIIIDRADHFGLAQLYQLRGRVGRSDKRAYCYLLIPPETQMTEDAKQRLQVIQRYVDLGSGFNIASHDLEIRGAGDLLGKEQSGHLHAVGVDLYFELLEEAIQLLKGKTKKVEVEPEINLKVAAYFPQDYLPDIGERIQFYRRLSSVESEEGIELIEEEIRDRIGPLPEEVKNLIGLMHLKLWLKRLHVLRMSAGPKKTSLQFAPSTPASPEKLVKLVQSDPKRYSVTPDQKFVFVSEAADWKTYLSEIQRLALQLDVVGRHS